MTFLLTALAWLAAALVLQAGLTALAAWMVSGRRPTLGSVIRALLLSGLSYGASLLLLMVLGPSLQALGLPVPALLLLTLLLPLLLSCWVLARVLGISVGQALATLVLTAVLFLLLGLLLAVFWPQSLPEAGLGAGGQFVQQVQAGRTWPA